VRTAERRHRGKLPSLRDRVSDPDPRIGPHHIGRVLACREELTEDLLKHAEVVDLAARHGRECLVEEHHALLDPVSVHEARPEVRERHKLQVGMTESAGHLQRNAKALLFSHAVGFEHAQVERHPTAFG